MPRTAPSAADKALLQRLREEGLEVTQTRLERWRYRGLLPRPSVVKGRGAGSFVEPHGEGVYAAATVLARSSGRGVPWQEGAAALVAYDLPLSTAALRAAAVFYIESPLAAARRIWAEAVAALPPTYALDDTTLPDLGDLVAGLAGEHRWFRSSLRLVREELKRLGHLAPEDDLEQAARVALALRLAAMQGARLSPKLRSQARYGITRRPRGELQMVLWDEQRACAATLTLDEVQRVSTLFDLLDEAERLPEGLAHPLYLAVRETSLRRLNAPPEYDASSPLGPDELGEWDEDLARLEADLASEADEASTEKPSDADGESAHDARPLTRLEEFPTPRDETQD